MSCRPDGASTRRRLRRGGAVPCKCWSLGAPLALPAFLKNQRRGRHRRGRCPSSDGRGSGGGHVLGGTWLVLHHRRKPRRRRACSEVSSPGQERLWAMLRAARAPLSWALHTLRSVLPATRCVPSAGGRPRGWSEGGESDVLAHPT